MEENIYFKALFIENHEIYKTCFVSLYMARIMKKD